MSWVIGIPGVSYVRRQGRKRTPTAIPGSLKAAQVRDRRSSACGLRTICWSGGTRRAPSRRNGIAIFSACARCRARRPVVYAICSRQLNSSIVFRLALCTAGKRTCSPQAMETSYLSFSNPNESAIPAAARIQNGTVTAEFVQGGDFVLHA